jgi:hypothetical protein
MLGNPFKQRSHYVYDYKPRYYDARKERIENLKKKYEQMEEGGDIPRITFTREQLKQEWAQHKRSSANRNTTIRLAIIIAVLVGITAYLFELHKLF